MPSRKEHERRSLDFLGEKFSTVHYFKDLPRVFLHEKHRRWFHDPKSDVVIGIVEGRGDLGRTLKAIAAGLIHDIDDFSSSRAKRTKKR